MRKFLLTAFVSLYALAGFSQLRGNGYYRVQNFQTQRYLYVCDNRGSLNEETTSADLGAIIPCSDFNRAIPEPSSVIYFNNTGGNAYRLHSQGTDTRDIVSGYDLLIRETNLGGQKVYQAYQKDAGMTKYLCDQRTDMSYAYGIFGTNVPNNDKRYKSWFISPIDAKSSNYFGFRPTVTVGTDHYAPFFAEFPFSFYSSGMTAYYVKKVDRGMAVIEEIKGDVKPGKTPMIVKCSSTNTADNKLNLLTGGPGVIQGNQLKGVYFCYPFERNKPHANATPYNPQTMRMLSVSAEGKLVFAKSNIKNIPSNTAYLSVPAGSPDEIAVVTQQQFDDIIASGIDEVISQQTEDTRVFNMSGVQVANDLSQLKRLPAGVYVVGGKKYVVK